MPAPGSPRRRRARSFEVVARSYLFRWRLFSCQGAMWGKNPSLASKFRGVLWKVLAEILSPDDGYSVVDSLSPPCRVREIGCSWGTPPLVKPFERPFFRVPENTFSLSSGRSRERWKIKPWRKYFLVIAIFRYIPSLRDEWEGSVLWVSPEKFVPQVVGHEKGEKLSLAEVFWVPSLT